MAGIDAILQEIGCKEDAGKAARRISESIGEAAGKVCEDLVIIIRRDGQHGGAGGCITGEWQSGTKSAKAKASQEGKVEGQAMRRREKPDRAGLKVTFEALAGRQGGKGSFGIEEAAEEVARRTKLAALAEQIAAYDRGYEGGRRRGPRCGQWQQ
jgi:hypothetical protein